MSRGDITAEEEVADSVFVQSYIPKTLEEVKNAEQDVFRISSGRETGDIFYQTITGLKQALPKAQPAAAQKEQVKENTKLLEESTANEVVHSDSKNEYQRSTEGDEENSSESEDSSSSETESQTPIDKKAARKENKKKVKEEKREARKTKVPKAVKKRKKKLVKAHKIR